MVREEGKDQDLYNMLDILYSSSFLPKTDYLVGHYYCDGERRGGDGNKHCFSITKYILKQTV